MIQQHSKIQFISVILSTIIGFLGLFLGIFLNPLNHYIHALVLIVCAIGTYLILALGAAEKNWMDIRAIFSGIWLGTIGLAALRLTDYQEPWQDKTWVLMAVAYAAFQIGATVGIMLGHKYFSRLQEKCRKFHIGRIGFECKENRLFLICIITTLIGLSCFLINVAIRGYIPCFSDSTTAYRDFYTKFHLFAVASTMVSGLCYYCIKTQPLNKIKKIALWACIFYLVILFPIMVVSRGVFIVVALSFTVTVFYLHKKRFIALLLCLVAIAGVYLFTSQLRNYTDDYLDSIFTPSEIPQKTPGHSAPPDDPLPPDAPDAPDDPDNIHPPISDTTYFSLSPRMAFLYGYLTVSHDNFNEAVQNTQGYTWGARQLTPLTVLIDLPFVSDILEDCEYYQVTPTLNTINMIGIFYYDFHEIGVFLCMLFWALLFGFIQSSYLHATGPFSLLVLAHSMTPIALSFFDAWVNSFDFWMFYGTILILAIPASIKHLPINKNNAME